MHRTAFTLIELLLVLAIIGILAAVGIPHFLDAQLKATQTQLVASMRSISNALEQYRIDNAGRVPGNSGPHMLRIMHEKPLYELTTPVAYLPVTTPQRRLITTPMFYGGPPDGGSNALAIYRGLLYSCEVRFYLNKDQTGLRSVPRVWQLAAGNPGYPGASLPALPVMTHPAGLSLLHRMENGYIPIDEYPPPLYLPVNPFYDPSNGLRSMGDFYLNSQNYNEI